MAGNPNFDEILATTLDNHRDTMVDAVFSARPLVFFLKQAGQIRMVNGGNKIIQPLMYAKNTTAGSYSGSDTLPTTAQGGITASEWEWKQYAASIVIEGLDEAKNSGEEGIIDLLDSKVTQTEETILENMDEMFLDDGTGNGGKDWNGLKNLVATVDNSVGGIDSTTNSWWDPNVTSGATVQTIKNMGSKYNSIAVGNDKPDLELTTQTIYEGYEGLLQANQRWVDSAAADGGFENLRHKGATIMYDEYVDAGYLYYLNTKYIRLIGHTNKWFTATPFKQPSNQDIRVAQIICYGNLVATNRKRLGAYTSYTAAT
jgi:hypothetical protein